MGMGDWYERRQIDAFCSPIEAHHNSLARSLVMAEKQREEEVKVADLRAALMAARNYLSPLSEKTEVVPELAINMIDYADSIAANFEPLIVEAK